MVKRHCLQSNIKMIKTITIDWSLSNRRELIKPFKTKDVIYAFIQARTGSKRFPNKIYQDINGAPMLWHTVNAAKQCSLLDDVIIISPGELPELPEGIKGFAYKGSETNVLSRYIAALDAFPCDYVVRLTSDCPLLDHFLIDFIIGCSLGYDYGSNVLECTFPDGMDAEVISAKTFRLLDKYAITDYDREHVTTCLRNNQAIQNRFDIVSIITYKNQSSLKLSVDTESDLKYVKEIENRLCPK